MCKSIIADIHADPHRLDRCFSVSDGQQIAFLGDFIDAGKGVEVVDDEAVLIKVKRLLDADKAIAVMGNHDGLPYRSGPTRMLGSA